MYQFEGDILADDNLPCHNVRQRVQTAFLNLQLFAVLPALGNKVHTPIHTFS